MDWGQKIAKELEALNKDLEPLFELAMELGLGPDNANRVNVARKILAADKLYRGRYLKLQADAQDHGYKSAEVALKALKQLSPTTKAFSTDGSEDLVYDPEYLFPCYHTVPESWIYGQKAGGGLKEIKPLKLAPAKRRLAQIQPYIATVYKQIEGTKDLDYVQKEHDKIKFNFTTLPPDEFEAWIYDYAVGATAPNEKMLEQARREQELREWEEARAEREMLRGMEEIAEKYRSGEYNREFEDMLRKKYEAEGVI